MANGPASYRGCYGHNSRLRQYVPHQGTRFFTGHTFWHNTLFGPPFADGARRPHLRDRIPDTNPSFRSMHAVRAPGGCVGDLALSHDQACSAARNPCRKQSSNVERNLYLQYAALNASGHRRKRRPHRDLLRAGERIHPRRLHLQRQSTPRPPRHAVQLCGHRPGARRLPLHH